MDENPQYYSPPPAHDQHLHKMIVYLTAFFIGLAFVVGGFIYFAPQILVHLPIEAEQRFVKPYEKLSGYWQQQFGEEATEERLKIEYYLQTLSNELGEASDLPDGMELKVHLINNDALNAFATLGGHIFVCRGLMESVSDENGLSMVLAHEIAHIKHRDPVVSMSRGLALQLIYSFVTGDYSRGSDWVFYGGDLGLLYFSREQESNADTQALTALQRYYGHISGYTRIFEIMRDELEEQGEIDTESDAPALDWLSSHPDLTDRINALRQQAIEKQWREGSSTLLSAEVRGWLEAL